MTDYLEKHGLDAGGVEALIDECVQSVVQDIMKGDKNHDPMRLLWYRLLDIVKGRKRDEKVDCSPEAVAVTLLRRGVPKEDVKVTHNRLTIKLNNSVYRVYRGTSGLPSGTFRIIKVYDWPCREETLEEGLLPTEEMADFLQAFDGLIPAIREKGLAVKKALEEYSFEKKKKEIEAAIVRSALADAQSALEQMKIGFHYNINEDGTLSVEFEQYLSASVTATIGDIQKLVNEPEKLRAMMVPSKRHDRRMTMFGGRLITIP